MPVDSENNASINNEPGRRLPLVDMTRGMAGYDKEATKTPSVKSSEAQSKRQEMIIKLLNTCKGYDLR